MDVVARIEDDAQRGGDVADVLVLGDRASVREAARDAGGEHGGLGQVANRVRSI